MDIVVVRVANGFGFDWVLVFDHTSDGSLLNIAVVRVATGFGFDWLIVLGRILDDAQ